MDSSDISSGSSSEGDYVPRKPKPAKPNSVTPEPVTPEPVSSQPVTLANPSDLTLIVGPSGQSIHVSKSALCLASSVWNSMFSGQWLESTKKEVEFPDDNPEALLIVLGIAHLRFKERPKTLSYRQLVKLAVICDKYDTVAVVRPFLQEWIANYDMEVAPGRDEWIFIAWTFGFEYTFITGVQHLVRNASADEDKCLWLTEPFTLRHSVNVRLPVDLMDSVSQARQKSISKLIDTAFKHLEQCVYAKGCSKAVPSGSDICIANITGHLLKGLHEVGLWPKRPDPSTYRSSFDDLYLRIKEIKIPRHTGIHTSCAKNLGGLLEQLDTINESVCLGYTEHHLKHIKVQAAK